MKLRSSTFIVALLFSAVSALNAQKPKVQLDGTWKAETPDGPRSVIIRPDSSASYGDETVRWRVNGDSIHIAFGDEWMVYGYSVHGTRLTLSGGDLEEPIKLRRAGPATPRPKGTDVPEAPPADKRGTGVPPGSARKAALTGSPSRTTAG